MLGYWLAVDLNPEYGNEVQKIMNFISEMNTEKIVYRVNNSAKVLL